MFRIKKLNDEKYFKEFCCNDRPRWTKNTTEIKVFLDLNDKFIDCLNKLQKLGYLIKIERINPR